MAESIHSARWISNIAGQGWDIQLFDFMEGGVSREIPSITTHTVYPPSKSDRISPYSSTYPFQRGSGKIKTAFPKLARLTFLRDRRPIFSDLLKKFRPDIVHSLEMQNESYNLTPFSSFFAENDIPWIYSTWGSDIYYFQRFESHQKKIQEVLTNCDYLITDCKRDISLATTNGFDGEILGVFPTAGGYQVESDQAKFAHVPPSKRKSIAVKGYQNIFGRGLMAIEAIRSLQDQLNGYEIEVYLASNDVIEAARELKQTSGLAITIHERLSNIEVIELFSRSRVALALSISDGSPNAMLEAMMMGAFPVQSDTESTAEWITDGENGFLVDPADQDTITRKLKVALESDPLVNSAGLFNRDLIRNTIDSSLLSPQIVSLYNLVFEKGKKKTV